MPAAGGRLLFLRKFMQQGTRVAAFVEASKPMAREVCRFVTSDRPQTILELGAGTGAVTQIAEQKMHPDSRLIACELDADFAAVMRERCPRTTVIEGDVAQLAAELPGLGVERVDVVLGGLPVPSLPKSVNAAVFEMLEQVAPDAVYSQQTLMPYWFQRLYRRLYEQVDFQLVLAFSFPAVEGVYHCRRLRADWRENLPGK